MRRASRAMSPKLDPREQHFRVPSPHPGLSLFLRYLPPPSRAAAGRDGALRPWRHVPVCGVDRAPVRRAFVARRAVRRRLPRLGARFPRLRRIRPVPRDGETGRGQSAARPRRRLLAPARSTRSALSVSGSARVPPGVADRAFLGHDRRRRVCRPLPRADRSAGVFRPDRAARAAGRAVSACRDGGWSR